ncbi:MAG: hypothetical protein IT385_24965 [Deltaproteobacteria bacterium]|nr:hypothetical protein [Deltaproteobacteria bacterium]
MRRFTSPILALTLLPFVITACGDDDGGGPNVSGNYQITSFTRVSGDGCTATPEPVPDASHLFLKTGDFFGVATLEAYVCPAADGCGVGDDAFTEWTFLERTSTGWKTSATASSFGGSSCSLSLTEQTLVTTETGVRIESENKYATFTDLSDAQCEPDAAKARASQLVCGNREVLEATKL